MAKIIVIDEDSATQSLLVKHLQTVGFEVINLDNKSVEGFVMPESIFPRHPKLKKVFDYIESNYQESIGLKDVAKSVGYSSAYLTDLVRKDTGKTVNDWIIARRLVQARHLLLKTNLSVDKIASKTGYKTLNHFFKQFRKHHNASPQAWKQTHSNNVEN